MLIHQSAAGYKNGDIKRDLAFAPEMVFVEGGSFAMGSNRSESEQPIHTVTLPSFWIGRFPLLYEEFVRFCESSKRDRPNMGNWSQPRNPVMSVSWYDANDYCLWLCQLTGRHYRLPSEAEWEYAARGGNISEGYLFAGSGELDTAAWHKENADNEPHPAGEKTPNELGLYDMSGNAWEWCADYHHRNYKGAPADGTPWLSKGDPKRRCLRGGAFSEAISGCFRPTYRHFAAPNLRGSSFGFRVIREL